MGEFGSYEKVEPIDLAGYVWTARKEGDASAQFVLKFCPRPAQHLRSAAELQKKLAEGKGAGENQPAYWAVIHHVGSPESGGAYYVTDQYKWSAQLVYDQKDRFTSGGLYRLVRGATLALAQIGVAYGRGHGNLKRSNVLLSERNLDRATVVLCDPGAPNSPELSDPTGDRRGLGKIVFELVTGQEFKDFLYPVRGTKKMGVLGPDGPKWLDWCNRLLAPANDPTACSLEQFRKELDAFSPAGESTGKKAPVGLIAAAVVGVVVIGGGAFFAMHGKTATAPPAKQDMAVAPPETTVPPVATTPPQPAPVTPAPQPVTPPPVANVQPIPAPTPVTPVPTVQEEADPRSTWDFALLKDLSQNRDALAQNVRQLKETFKGIPGVPDAVADVPAVKDAGAAIAGMNWPADKQKILDGKADLDRAVADARKTVAANTPGTAWSQALRALQAVTFHNPAIGERWKKLVADPRLANGYSADQFAVSLPDAYARLSALDRAAGQAEPQALAGELDPAVTDKSATPQSLVDDMGRQSDAIRKNRSGAEALAAAKTRWDAVRATTFTHAAVSQSFQAFATSLGSIPPDQAIVKAQPAVESLRDVDSAWPDNSPVADAAIAAHYQDLVKQSAQEAVGAIIRDPGNGGKAAQDFKNHLADLGKQAAAVAEAMKTVAAVTAVLDAPDSLDRAKWQDRADRLTSAAAVPAGWPDTGAAAVLEQTKAVVAALNAPSADQLLNLAAQGKPKALMLAVCQRWMSVHGDAELDYKLYGAVKAGMGEVPAPVRANLSQVWLKHVLDSPGNADHLWDLYGKMELDPALPSAEFNSLLATLKKSVQDGKLSLDQAKAFLAQTKPLANDKILGGAKIAEISEKLSSLIPGGAAVVHAGGLPPGIQRDGNDLVRNDPAFPMRFVHIPANGSVRSYYLCTTDVPVGWFIGIASAPQQRAMMQKLMKTDVPRAAIGPVAWVPDENGWIRAKGGNDPWLTVGPTWANDFAGALQIPSARMPMQYVNPLAAMYAASLAGCRLPTAAEWTDAYQSGGLRAGNENVSGSNYADLIKQIKNIKTLNPGENGYLQHFEEEVNISGFQGALAQGATQLWFREVSPGAEKLQDMAGNVSDWVLDADPAPVTAKFDEAAGTIQVTTPAGVVNAQNLDDAGLADFYNHCQRIGLSSTSDNTFPPATAAAVPKDKVGKRRHHFEFYDVGFRLALDDPSGGSGPDPVAAYVMELKPIEP